VSLKYEDDQEVLGSIERRKVMKQLYEIYASDHLAGKQFAYDGHKGLFTAGPLPFKNNVFDVVVEGAPTGKYKVHLFDSIFSLAKPICSWDDPSLWFWGLLLIVNVQDWNEPEPRRRWQSRTK
jgi:hypothetical protein